MLVMIYWMVNIQIIVYTIKYVTEGNNFSELYAIGMQDPLVSSG